MQALLRFTVIASLCWTFALASFLSPYAAQLIYPGTSRSERDLTICPENAACSVLHRRFWGAPPLVERLCRCAGRLECPATWGNAHDPLSMHLNTRAQLKFCKDVIKLKRCRSKSKALTITSRHLPEDSLTQTEANIITMAISSCFCPGPPVPRHWQHVAYSKKDYNNGTLDVANIYACAKIPRCENDQYCGNVRADLFSSYYHCSCPRGSLCVFKRDEVPRNVSEVLFSGEAYKASCTTQETYSTKVRN